MDFLNKKVDSTALGLFRAVFGLFMVIEVLYFLKIDFVKNALILPKVQFSYTYFEWLKPFPEPALNFLVFLLLVAAVCIMIGKFFRPASILFSLGFLYLLLLDKGHFNNHTYMFSLVAFLLSFTDADKRFSIGKKTATEVPNWQYHILRAQLFIVYFYGGLAKLNPDWLLCGEPIRAFLDGISPGAGENDTVVEFFKWGGLMFDLLIGFALFYRPTRMIALLFVAFFNFSNAIIFDDIGIFPFIMFSSTVIFLEEGDRPLRWLKGLLGIKMIKVKEPVIQHVVVPKVLVLYFVFQLLFPFRYMLLPHDKDWTGIGQRFAWRMKIQNRPVQEYSVYVVDPVTKRQSNIQINTFINTMQMKYMSQDPVMLWQFARFMKEEAARQGIRNAEVHARISVSMNGSPYQYIVDPETDISAQDFEPLGYNSWIPERSGNCSD